MTKINSNLFNQISFFLGGSKEVKSLKEGSKLYGGATKRNDKVYSNVESDNFITINDTKNTLSIFIPSTLNADSKVNNEEYVTKYHNIIKTQYNTKIAVEDTKGGWYSEDLDKVIVEDITILEIKLEEVTQQDISFFLNLGLLVKQDMSQEAVSVNINSSLCLV
jgi:hypothetical protein